MCLGCGCKCVDIYRFFFVIFDNFCETYINIFYVNFIVVKIIFSFIAGHTWDKMEFWNYTNTGLKSYLVLVSGVQMVIIFNTLCTKLLWNQLCIHKSKLSSSAPISASTYTKTNGARADTKFGFRPSHPSGNFSS